MSKAISAFAYNTAKAIEELINIETSNIIFKNRDLEASIFLYRQRLKDFISVATKEQQELILLDYDRHFNIKTDVRGNNREELGSSS